jgi:hypothetical protein
VLFQVGIRFGWLFTYSINYLFGQVNSYEQSSYQMILVR